MTTAFQTTAPVFTGPRLGDLPIDDARAWYARAAEFGFSVDDDTRTDEIEDAERFVDACHAERRASTPWGGADDAGWAVGDFTDDLEF